MRVGKMVIGKNLLDFIKANQFDITDIPSESHIKGKRSQCGGYILSNKTMSFKVTKYYNCWCWSVHDTITGKIYSQVGNVVSVIRTIIKTETYINGVKN